jgi:signal transduction histidine kinase
VGSATQLTDDFSWVEDLASLLAIVTDAAGGARLASASYGFLRALGLGPEIIGLRLEDVLVADPPLAPLVEHAFRFGSATRCTALVAARGRETTRFGLIIRPARGGDPFVVLEAARLQDTSALPDDRLVTLFEELGRINGGAIVLNPLERATTPNLAALLGYTEHEWPREREALEALVHPEDRNDAAAHRQRLAALADGEFATLVQRMRHIRGDWRWIELRERLFEPVGFLASRRVLTFATDISEQRQLQKSLNDASKALLRAEGEERRRIARELHDSTVQHLVALDLTLSRLERRTGNDAEHQEILSDFRTALAAAHREVRVSSYLLHPPDIERKSLALTLRKFLDGFATRTGLMATLRVEGSFVALPSIAKLALFRVAQEALMNVHRHAKASNVAIRLSRSAATIVLEIEDDGIGLPAADVRDLLSEACGGVGISGMKARMRQIGGTLDLTPQKRGLCVRASLPLKPRRARPVVEGLDRRTRPPAQGPALTTY